MFIKSFLHVATALGAKGVKMNQQFSSALQAILHVRRRIGRYMIIKQYEEDKTELRAKPQGVQRRACLIKGKGVKEDFSEEDTSELNLEGGKGFPQVDELQDRKAKCIQRTGDRTPHKVLK